MTPEKEELHRLYHEKELTQKEIGSRYDVTKATVSKWMSEAGVKARDATEASRLQWGVPSLRHDKNGYEKFNSGNTQLLHHRLLAVAEFGYDAVVEKDVHHANGIEWDNRPSNLELMKKSDHASHHHKQTNFTDDLLIMELYHNDNMTQSDIGEIFGINQSEVSRRVA